MSSTGRTVAAALSDMSARCWELLVRSSAQPGVGTAVCNSLGIRVRGERLRVLKEFSKNAFACKYASSTILRYKRADAGTMETGGRRYKSTG